MTTENKSTRKKLKKFLISALVISIAVAGVYSISRMPVEEAAELIPEEVIVNVEVEEVIPEKAVADYLDLPGTARPGRIVNVPVELAGKIVSIPAREGELIQKGAVILKLDDSILRAEVSRAKAQADFEKKSVNRTSMLLEKGVTNHNSLDEIESRYAVSSAALKMAETNLEKTVVYSPYTGILNDLPVEQGEFVQEGATIAKIVEIDTLKVEIQVPEKEVEYLRKGTAMRVISGSSDNPICYGTLTYISEVADMGTRTVKAEISVDNSKGVLRSGQIVRARLNRRSLRDAVMVPLAAVIPLEEGKVVYVVSGGVAERREVELGVMKGTEVHIKSGLTSGDLLIVKGHRMVGQGQKVNIVS
ncbi:MAG: efflux RND transporter periplasmic adaptor subunit [Acidobacteriota bacterium]